MTTKSPTSNNQKPIPYWRSAVVLVLCAITTVICMSRSEVNSSVEAGVIMKLPRVLGGYVGESLEVSEAEKTILPMDTEFERIYYTSVDGQTGINCQIVLSGGEKRSIHRPEVCLPGQGWDKKQRVVREVKLDDDASLEVIQWTLERPVVMRDGSKKTMQSLFYYWFVGKDKTTAFHHDRVLLTSMDRVLHNINHRWAYIVVSSNVPGSLHSAGADREQMEKVIEDFIADVAPYIHQQEVLDSLQG